MTELIAACANLRVMINAIEEAVAFNLPLEQINHIELRSELTESFLNALNQQLNS